MVGWYWLLIVAWISGIFGFTCAAIIEVGRDERNELYEENKPQK